LEEKSVGRGLLLLLFPLIPVFSWDCASLHLPVTIAGPRLRFLNCFFFRTMCFGGGKMGVEETLEA
jgi:hypothetical protein